MTIKMTMLFQQSSAPSSPGAPVHRIGGWTESWYTNQSTISAAINLATQSAAPLGLQTVGIVPARAQLLGLGAAIVGLRFQSVVPAGPSQSVAVNYPGNASHPNDAPQLALLCKAPGLNVNNVRRFTLRGLPDANTIEGEFSNDPVFSPALTAFFASLVNWQFRGRDLSQLANKILSISALGVVTFEVGVTYNVLDFVRILKSKDSSGNLRGGRFQVGSIGPGPNVITLNNWGFGATTGGTGRKDVVVFPAVDAANTNFSRVVTRRVGRPFTQYRGRRSRRR